jgi:hypothetical protein
MRQAEPPSPPPPPAACGRGVLTGVPVASSMARSMSRESHTLSNVSRFTRRAWATNASPPLAVAPAPPAAAPRGALPDPSAMSVGGRVSGWVDGGGGGVAGVDSRVSCGAQCGLHGGALAGTPGAVRRPAIAQMGTWRHNCGAGRGPGPREGANQRADYCKARRRPQDAHRGGTTHRREPMRSSVGENDSVVRRRKLAGIWMKCHRRPPSAPRWMYPPVPAAAPASPPVLPP